MGSCVITAEEKLPDFALLASALAAASGLDLPTAAIQARHSWGILGENLDEAAAAALAEKYEALGVKTLKLPVAALPRLPAPLQIKKIVFEGEKLSWQGGAGEAGTAGAGEILALAAIPLKEETLQVTKTTQGPSGAEKAIRFGIMSMTGLPIGLGRSKEIKKETRSRELAFYLDILLGADRGRLRLSPSDFDFSCLKEKKTYSSQTNFRVLALELATFARGALKNTCMLAMRENKPLTGLPYDSMEDLETELRRLAASANSR